MPPFPKRQCGRARGRSHRPVVPLRAGRAPARARAPRFAARQKLCRVGPNRGPSSDMSPGFAVKTLGPMPRDSGRRCETHLPCSPGKPKVERATRQSSHLREKYLSLSYNLPYNYPWIKQENIRSSDTEARPGSPRTCSFSTCARAGARPSPGPAPALGVDVESSSHRPVYFSRDSPYRKTGWHDNGSNVHGYRGCSWPRPGG